MKRKFICAAGLIACVMLTSLLAACEPAAPKPYELPESPYAPEDFTYAGEYLTCSAGSVLTGIDVSSHQGQIDWQAVADAGIRYAFVRLGYRGYSNGELMTDAMAQQNLAGAKAAGIAVGAYFFSQAISVEEALEEADYAMQILGDFQLDLPLVYDWEYVNDTARTAGVDARTLTDCTLAFCRAVESQGHDAMIYFNSHQIKNLLYGQELEAYPWWLAKYDHAMDFPCRVDMWQYSNQGSVPGIAGQVDLNVMFADYGLGKAWLDNLS